jgi:hypothetical protein
MAQTTGLSRKMTPIQAFSDREVATFAAITLAKGFSDVSAFVDGLKESENLQNSKKGTITRNLPQFENGCGTGPEPDHAVGQHPWSSHSMHLQTVSQPWRQTLGNWPLSRIINEPNQDPAPFQTYRQSPTEHLNREQPVNSISPISNVRPFGLCGPSSISLVESRMFIIF